MASPAKTPLDWSELHRRLDAIQQTIDHGWQRSNEDKRRILRDRAQALAAEAPGRESARPALDVLEFHLAHERYGIELEYVREVYPLKDLTPLPGTPAFILGVTNVRGQILLIIDIKKLFDLPEQGLTDLNRIIVVHSPGVELGVLADAVLGLQSVPVDEIQPTLPTLNGIREEYLRGVTRESMVLLDARKLLSVRQAGWGG